LLRKAPRPKNDYEATNQLGTITWLSKNISMREQLQLLQQTLKELTAQYNTWLIAWGDINRFQRNEKSTNNSFDDKQWSVPSPLASAAFGSLPAYSSSRFNTTKRYGTRGNSFVAAVEFGKRLKAKTIMTGGESFDRASQHFTDQTEGFLLGQFKEINFYKEEVLRHKQQSFKPGEEGNWR
jgi:acyl-homoserine lactone acylase PvdQ